MPEKLPTPLFEIHNEIELLALWRLVAEAKFQVAPDDADLWGSPYVHQLSQRIADSLLAAYEARGDFDAARRHRLWRKSTEENVVWPVVVSNLRRDAKLDWWKSFSDDEKVTYVIGCIAPFELSSERIGKLISESEA